MHEDRLADLKKLDSMPPEDRDSLLRSLESEWQSMKETLITTLGSRSKQTVFCSAFLVGMNRYAEAAGSLARLITLEDEARSPKRRRWGQYPVAEALVRIGKPVIPAMLRNLETSDDEKTRRLTAKVILRVEGVEVAKSLVTSAIAKQQDPERKGRLRSSLVYFEERSSGRD